VSDHIIIDPRFCGPPTSGNGGYVCGILAGYADGPVAVTLRHPPPLDRPLAVDRDADGPLRLLDGTDVIAEAHPTTVDIEVPEPPTYAAAEIAATAYPGFDTHVFPACFVCGPNRTAGDGLRIFSGEVPGTGLFAAPWIPADVLADADGFVRPEFLWAALDCPGVWPCLQARAGRTATSMVLGQLAAHITHRLRSGDRTVVVGWPIGADGRKHYAGTAVFSEDGALCGKASATWIELQASK
jgi:hypothetical protein